VGFWRAIGFGEGLFVANDFRRFFEFGDFSVFPDFLAEAIFRVFRAAFDFVLFAIAILLKI
jgi:hypothetical protein